MPGRGGGRLASQWFRSHGVLGGARSSTAPGAFHSPRLWAALRCGPCMPLPSSSLCNLSLGGLESEDIAEKEPMVKALRRSSAACLILALSMEACVISCVQRAWNLSDQARFREAELQLNEQQGTRPGRKEFFGSSKAVASVAGAGRCLCEASFAFWSH